MSDEPLYLSFRTHKDYLILPRAVVRELGPSRAVVLAELLCKEFLLGNKRPEDGWFYFKLGEISRNTGISVNQISAYLKEFAGRRGLISVKRGSGRKNFYRLNREAVEKLFESAGDPSSPDSGGSNPQKAGHGREDPVRYVTDSGSPNPQRVGDRSPEKWGSILDNNLIYKDRKRSSEENAPDGALGDEMSHDERFQNPSSGKRPEKKTAEGTEKSKEGRRARGALRQEIRELILEVLPLGEFTNRPPEEGKPVAKLYLDVQKFLSLLPNPDMFARAYDLDPQWMRDKNIDLKWFRGRPVEPLVRRAAKRFALMRKEGYEPQNKAILTKYIQTFFYNPKAHKSWFLQCIFNEPQTVAEGSDARAVATLSEEERKLILHHKRPDWDEQRYLAKAARLLAWHRDTKEDVRLYNTFIRDSQSAWSEHFSGFRLLMETIVIFASEWRNWTLGNFGYGNKTWAKFVAWSRMKYNVELEPPLDKVKAARELQKIVFKEASEREREIAEEEAKEDYGNDEDDEDGGDEYEEPVSNDPY